jgi:hypothetical protein
MRHELCTTIAVLCALLAAAQSSSAQGLTAGQEARILQRFPQADVDGDGKLSSEELAPLREQLERWQARQAGQTNQPTAEPKGPAPTYADLQYGDHKNTVMDVWLAVSDKPSPIVVAIHGGGFSGGDKSKYHDCEELKKCLENGVSFATINYRFRNEDPRGVLACLHDSKRAIQFIRHQAEEWNIDKERVAAYGGSAGAGTTLWLACHDEMADPDNLDPVLRESTRLAAGGLNATQATYDILQWRDFIPLQQEPTPELENAREPELLTFYGVQSLDELDTENGKAIRREYDMLAWMSADDPPLWMKNGQRGGPAAPGDRGHMNHHPAHVVRLKERAEEAGMHVVAIAPNAGLAPKLEVSMIDFFFKQLGVE